jgi:hypothetical protein
VRRSLALDQLVDDLLYPRRRTVLRRVVVSPVFFDISRAVAPTQRHTQKRPRRWQQSLQAYYVCRNRHFAVFPWGGANYTPRLAPTFVGDAVGGIPIVGLKKVLTMTADPIAPDDAGGWASQHEPTVCLSARGSRFQQGMAERIVPLQQKHP